MNYLNLSDRDIEKLTRFFYVFSDPTRLKIILTLLTAEHGSRCVNNIAEQLDINQPTVSQQLRVLKEAGLVKVVRDRQFYRYSIKDEHVAELINLGIKHITEK
jgi:DNA-binding transcriptional ArsR family regulator